MTLDDGKFCRLAVATPDTKPGEVVYVVGSDAMLGAWDPIKGIPLAKQDEVSNTWVGTVYLGEYDMDFDENPIAYRYYIALPLVSVDEHTGDNTISSPSVRLWETHKYPRLITEEHFTDALAPDEFGYFDDESSISSGWLIKQHEVRVRLQHNCLQIWHSRYKKQDIYMKVTPYDIKIRNDLETLDEDSDIESHLYKYPAHATPCLVSVLQTRPVDHNDSIFTDDSAVAFGEQPPEGIRIKPNSLLLYSVQSVVPEQLGLSCDFYVKVPPTPSAAPSGDQGTEVIEGVHLNPPPGDKPQFKHIGYAYIMPSHMDKKLVFSKLHVYSFRHGPIGELIINAMIINPVPGDMVKCTMEQSFARRWKRRAQLHVGHRGFGNSHRKEQSSSVRENTIASLTAAAAYGADFVEFDVQLSADFKPIIYHDFHVGLNLMRKWGGSTESLPGSHMPPASPNNGARSVTGSDDFIVPFPTPVKDLLFSYLQTLKLNHVTEVEDDGRLNPVIFEHDHIPEHQSFPTLAQAFHIIPIHTGFNIEIKYPQNDENDRSECPMFFEANDYLNKILDCVWAHAGNRRIIFSCFDADICTMMKLKQNKYPVLFLTQGRCSRYIPFKDVRLNDSNLAISFAAAEQILGVNLHSEDLIGRSHFVSRSASLGLVSFVWGDDLNDGVILNKILSYGVDGVVHDRISEAYPDKMNVFCREKSSRKEVTAATNQAASRVHSRRRPDTTACVSPPVSPGPGYTSSEFDESTPTSSSTIPPAPIMTAFPQDYVSSGYSSASGSSALSDLVMVACTTEEDYPKPGSSVLSSDSSASSSFVSTITAGDVVIDPPTPAQTSTPIKAEDIPEAAVETSLNLKTSDGGAMIIEAQG